MAKKRRVIIEGPQKFSDSEIDKDNGVSELEGMKIMVMTALSEMGVTPDEYANFLDDSKRFNEREALLRSMAEEFSTKKWEPEEVQAMPDAAKKSLRIKIQLKGVAKPPLWREVVIPADFNFSQLHFVIQAVTGLCNCHLWQFQRQAYNPDLQIGIPAGGGYGLDEWTHDADKTPVTGFLSKKGDKLEYVYDFGDDWIFVVSVIEIMDRGDEVAVCTKWKCEFQPIENCGGVWAYLQLRDAFSAKEQLTAKQKREVARNLGVEDFERLELMVGDTEFDIEFIQEQLAEIPESGRMDDDW